MPKTKKKMLNNGNVITILPAVHPSEQVLAVKPFKSNTRQESLEASMMYPVRRIFRENAQLRSENMRLRGELARLRMGTKSTE